MREWGRGSKTRQAQTLTDRATTKGVAQMVAVQLVPAVRHCVIFQHHRY